MIFENKDINDSIVIGELLEYLDSNLRFLPFNNFDTYVYPEPLDGLWLIRYPGATRGHIKIVNFFIEDIVIYQDNELIYNECVLEGVKQFIGRSIW